MPARRPTDSSRSARGSGPRGGRSAADSACDYLMLTRTRKPMAAPWIFVVSESRNRAGDDVTDIYRRAASAEAATAKRA